MYFYSTNEEQLKNMNKIAFLCKKKSKKHRQAIFCILHLFWFSNYSPRKYCIYHSKI